LSTFSFMNNLSSNRTYDPIRYTRLHIRKIEAKKLFGFAFKPSPAQFVLKVAQKHAIILWRHALCPNRRKTHDVTNSSVFFYTNAQHSETTFTSSMVNRSWFTLYTSLKGLKSVTKPNKSPITRWCINYFWVSQRLTKGA